MTMPDTLYRKLHEVSPRMVRELVPPNWAMELVGACPRHRSAIDRIDGERFALVTARVADAADLSPDDFERRTFEAYDAIAQQLRRAPRRHAVRFWNHVPFITDPADAGRDNYMVFNAGRFRAFSQLLGGPARFERDVATASATGHWQRDLVVHCLAADHRGAAINNPRQVAPYHYSQRFGPLPPCFSRATRLSHPANLLLVGGTASVRGEDSVHADDLANQTNETFVNLAALVGAAAGKKLTPAVKLPQWLGAFTELRVYYPDPADGPAIERAVAANFPRLRRLEMLPADLCRAELLVEIEGIADLSLFESK